MPENPPPQPAVAIEVRPVQGIGEVVAGTDLVGLVGASAALRDGDVVLVTSKIVSKAEGRVVAGDREEAVTRETVRTVARRGATRIVENHLGLVMAAAGVDASNVESGHLVLLPIDPDATARALREGLHDRFGHDVAVVVTDTAGRAWRNGQTDIAIGVAGLEPVEEYAGRVDDHGNRLAVTAPAIADELAGIAEVASGKLGRRPVVVVRGLADRVLPRGEHGPGARALVRPRHQDMFGLGAREAVLAALDGSGGGLFGSPAPAEDLLDALTRCGLEAGPGSDAVTVDAPASDPRVRALALAHAWRVEPTDEGGTVLRPDVATAG